MMGTGFGPYHPQMRANESRQEIGLVSYPFSKRNFGVYRVDQIKR
jgi:hypothetical protein